MKRNYAKLDIELDDVHPDTIQKELSKWKNDKSLPSFIKMILILNSIESGISEQKIGYFFQLLIIRALLHIKKEFDIKEDINKRFLQKLSKFRKEIKSYYSTKEESKIYKEQLKYTIVNPNSFENDELSLNEVLNKINSNMKKYLEYNFDKDEKLNTKLPNRLIYINEFNQCNSKESYLELLEKISDVPNDTPNYQFYNNGYNLLRFIIAIKIEDQRLFTKQFKYFDKVLTNRNISCTIIPRDPSFRIVDISIDCIATGTDLNAIQFHIEEVVKKAGIVNWLEKQWIKIYQEPVTVIQTLDEDTIIRNISELDMLLDKFLQRVEKRNKTPNNWESILIHGITRDLNAKQFILERHNDIVNRIFVPEDN